MTTVIADREGCPKSSRANSAAFLYRRTQASARGCFCPWTFKLDMYVPAARLIKQKRAQPLSQTIVLVPGDTLRIPCSACMYAHYSASVGIQEETA